MPLEYEYSFYEFNKKDILSKIKTMGFKRKGIFLFKVQTFYHPLFLTNDDKNKHYIRVRDEGHRITMTHKFSSVGIFEDETEVNVDNFESAVKLLENIGCTKKYYYEKIREIWFNKDTEVVFDTNPGNIDRMEIEAKSKKELNSIIKSLELNSKIGDKTNKYLELFGIIIPKNIDLKFTSVKKSLLPHVKKNKKEFVELVNEQIKKYRKLFKK
jgi:adenylate cyclase class IV